MRESEIKNNYMYQTWTLYKEESQLFSINLGTYIYIEKEFNKILKDIGFTIENTFGNYNKSAFNLNNSDRLIYKLKK